MKEWFSPAELAEMQLPDMPRTHSAIVRRAKSECWQSRQNALGAPLARRRQGKGGGWEYHYTVLPMHTQLKLTHDAARLEKKVEVKSPADRPRGSELWAAYDSLPDGAKKTAAWRLTVLEEIDALTRGGWLKNAAANAVVDKWRSEDKKISARSVWRWNELVAGLERQDWQAALAPNHRGGVPTSECCAAAWEYFKADYLRLSQPTAESCYERLGRIKDEQAFGHIPPLKTMMRRLQREVDRRIIVLRREGDEALRRLYPPLERDRSVFHALEAVNADGHEWDIRAHWPDGTEGRAKTVFFQDLRTGRILSWRTALTENADSVRLAYADVVMTYGIPDFAYLDNGRGFAGKWMSGGTPFRFRGKVTAEEQTGIFKTCGTEVHFSIPRRGQSKPIERAFGDLQDRVSRRAEFDGAYTGNSPMKKPANYGTRTVPIDLIEAIIDEEVEAHNARQGRRSAVCNGRSFDEAFYDSFNKAREDGLIRTAPPEMQRLLLLPAEKVKADRQSGHLKLYGNRFWSEFLVQYAGEPLIARFDPQNLHRGAHVYRMNNRYLGFAECLESAGFNDTRRAREQERRRRRHVKLTKERDALENKLSDDELMAAHESRRRSRSQPVAPEPDTNVVRPHFAGNLALKVEEDEVEDADVVMLDFMKGVAATAADD